MTTKLEDQLHAALLNASQFLSTDVKRGPDSNGWANSVESVVAADAAYVAANREAIKP